jgi:hypothetical protein
MSREFWRLFYWNSVNGGNLRNIYIISLEDNLLLKHRLRKTRCKIAHVNLKIVGS